MSQDHFQSPEHAARHLTSNPEKAGAENDRPQVCFGPSKNGWFSLSWSARVVGTYDWVGLYTSSSKPDSEYISGLGNWEWASKASPFVTGVACQPGYQARYLTWDAQTSKYVSIAKTPAFPEKVCSE